MNQHPSALPPAPEPQRQQFAHPTREMLVENQIETCLQVLECLKGYLLLHTRDVEQQPALDGGAVSAGVATFMKACQRIDSILDSNESWKLDGHIAISKSILDVHEAQKKFLQEQAASAAEVRRPSYQLRPTLLSLGAEGFAAVWGDVSTPGAALVGRGSTPKAALLDFDAAFERTPSEQLILMAEKNGIDLESTATPPTTPTTKQPRRKKQ